MSFMFCSQYPRVLTQFRLHYNLIINHLKLISLLISFALYLRFSCSFTWFRQKWIEKTITKVTNDPGHLYYNLKGQPHFATPPLVSPRKDVWEASAEIPYWWRLTSQIWVVLLIGRAAKEIYFNQSEALPRSFHSIFPLLKKMFPTWLKQTFLCVHCDGSALCFSTASLSLLSAPVITQLTLSPVCNRKRTLVSQSCSLFSQLKERLEESLAAWLEKSTKNVSVCDPYICDHPATSSGSRPGDEVDYNRFPLLFKRWQPK